MNSQVTIVIVNWNRKDCVLNLLESLRTMPHAGVRIIVVDNASTDGSAAAIRNHPLPVTLLENRENLGGTGGFNTGIRYALELPGQEFIWLLDNDVEVAPDTLDRLVGAMTRDPSIGVAGSCILSPEDRSVIVEAGGFVDRRRGTWTPNRRYQPHAPLQGKNLVEPVHYVPACSALIRVSAVRRIDMLDERFFLHWDDIDFCARVREAGYRVVSVLDSPAYHGAEKGYSPITLYYDFRNALLFQAKHRQGRELVLSVRTILGNYLSSLVYLFLLGQRKPARHLFAALRDFMDRRFGRAPVSPAELASPAPAGRVAGAGELRDFRNVLLFAVGSFDDVAAAVRGIRECDPSLSVTVAVAADRAEVYRLPGVDALIRFDLFRSGLRGKLATARAILGGGFRCGITAGGPFVVPYAFLLRRNLHFDRRDGTFRRLGVSFLTLWKVPLAMVGGKLLAALFLAPVVRTCSGVRSTLKNEEPAPSGGGRNPEEPPAP
ncbi:MAG TPA: glycosyltransferase family 2 protein [Desulfuromonadaceae bacterium]